MSSISLDFSVKRTDTQSEKEIAMNDYRPNVSYAFLLFARPSFWEGIARIFDLGSTLQVYNRSRSTVIADANALRSDWRAVGQDIANAIEGYEQEQETSKNAKRYQSAAATATECPSVSA